MELGILVVAGVVVIFYLLGYQHGKKKALRENEQDSRRHDNQT